MDRLSLQRYPSAMPSKESLSSYRREGETLSQTPERLRHVVERADRDAFVAALRNTAVGRSILEMAVSVFGSKAAARTWMTSPAIGLGGRSAAELLGTDEGRQQLLDYLGRLDLGVYS